MTSNETVIYSENWSPWFSYFAYVFVLCRKYGVIIERDEDGGKNDGDLKLTFGYGWSGPNKLTSKTTYISKIKPGSIIVGSATGMENFKLFGGWGIRMGIFNGTYAAYNAKNGPYIEFIEKVGNKERKYRFVSENVEKVASIMRGEFVDK